jgi:hypothetical protein
MIPGIYKFSPNKTLQPNGVAIAVLCEMASLTAALPVGHFVRYLLQALCKEDGNKFETKVN